jgi:hypothetical protein
MRIALNRNRLSSWLMLCVILIIATGFFVVEFLQIPLYREKEINQYRVLIKQEVLRDINSLVLKNKVGEFRIAKSETPNQWTLLSPRRLPASGNAIKSIFSLLENIRVLKLYDNEPINRSNFSLTNPYLSLQMTDSQKQQHNIDFGLINPIDGTSYIYSSNTNQIYHIDAIDAALATLDLNELVDGRVFIFSPTYLSSLTVSRISYGSKKQIFSIARVDKNWIDQSNKTVSDEIVQNYLTEISSIKSSMILDSIEDSHVKTIDSIINDQQYELTIKDIDENIQTFIISNFSTKSINDYKIEKGKSILIRPNNEKIVYVLNRDISKLFQINLANANELSFKKLFY